MLEAAASNIPVISTPVGSGTSFVDNNSGYVVDLKDFIDAMIKVMNNYNKAKIKSNILHQKVSSTYQIGAIVKKYESVYQK